MKRISSFLFSILTLNLVSAQVDLVGEAKGLFGGFSIGSTVGMLGYGLLFLVVGGVVAFFLKNHLLKKRFNKTITFFKRNPYTGLLVADKNLKAMTVRLDSVGNLGYRLQTPYETKNLIPKLKYEAKTNHHYVEYCEDGRIVEITGFSDYDDDRRSVKASFSDHNTELARSSMHQMNKERYDKKNFWKENASLLVNIGALVIIMVFLWLITQNYFDTLSTQAGLLEQSSLLQETNANIVDSLNRLLNSEGFKTVINKGA